MFGNQMKLWKRLHQSDWNDYQIVGTFLHTIQIQKTKKRMQDSRIVTAHYNWKKQKPAIVCMNIIAGFLSSSLFVVKEDHIKEYSLLEVNAMFCLSP